MTLVLRCPYGHTRELPEVTTRAERKLIEACVRGRLSRCFICRAAIVRCELKVLS